MTTESDLHDLTKGVGQSMWSGVVDALLDLVAIVTEEGTVVAVNAAWRDLPAMASIDGYSVGADFLDACDAMTPDPFAVAPRQGVEAVLAGVAQSFLMTYPLGDRWFQMRVNRLPGDGPARSVVTHTDISYERGLEQHIHARAALLDRIDVAVTAVDDVGLVSDWNAGAERAFGYTREEAMGARADELVVVDSSAAPWSESVPETATERLVTLRRKDGTSFPARHRLSPLDATGGATGTVDVTIDATAEAVALREIAEARDFLQLVTDSMAEGMFVLDAEGRVQFFTRSSERLLGWSRDQVLGHLIHDFCHGGQDADTAHAARDCPLTGASRDRCVVRLQDDTFTLADGTLLAIAYSSDPLPEASGGGSVVVFADVTVLRTEELRLRERLDELAVVLGVREVLREDRLVLFAQPIVDLRTGVVTQNELLLRIPVEGDAGAVQSPVPFLRLAEELGLGSEVDRWVIRRAINLAAQGHVVEVNISAASMSDQSLLDDIEQWIGASDVDPRQVVFEITETAILTEEAAGRAFAEKLRALGCGIALDDFGTGYGGFSYLKKLAVDYLKIDMEFVRDLVTSPASRLVVEAVVSMARGFGLKTVAEGVEDARTLELLRDLGVDYGQGYHIGRPGPLDQVLPLRPS